MFSSHERGPGRSTNRWYIITVKDHSTVGQFVDVWSRDLGRSVKTDVIPALWREIGSKQFHAFAMVDRIEGGQNKLCRCVINPTDEETCLDASKYLFEIFSWSENGWKIFIWTAWVAILLWRISPTAKRINEKTTGVTFTPVKTIYHCATFRLSFKVLYALKFDKIASATET